MTTESVTTQKESSERPTSGDERARQVWSQNTNWHVQESATGQALQMDAFCLLEGVEGSVYVLIDSLGTRVEHDPMAERALYAIAYQVQLARNLVRAINTQDPPCERANAIKERKPS